MKTRRRKQCLDCGASIGPYAQRCGSCATKIRAKDPEYMARFRQSMARRSANPQWRTSHTLAMQTRAKDPAWIHTLKNIIRKRGRNGSWLENIRRVRGQQAANPKWIRAIRKNNQDPAWKAKISGPHNGQWQGGISFEPYSPEFNQTLKQKIRERDGHVCQHCHIPENGIRLCVHHVDYNKNNNAPNNLISLCKHCHLVTNSNRPHWKSFFRSVQKTQTCVSAPN